MIEILEKSKCSGCHACAEICPKKCIQMISDDEGFWYPNVDTSQCTNCGLCEKNCPIITPRAPTSEADLVAYAAINKEEPIRLKSSSGGIFSALATCVLGQGGVVFGAAFDGDFNVVHKYIESVEELDCLRGSKYVQSKIGDSYRQAEGFLRTGRLVFFSGTPCQIEGLLSYLRKPYENLITQDLICHGVPSPMVWQKYVEYRCSRAGEQNPEEISFRAKNTGWKGFSTIFSFENGLQYTAVHDKDPMMQVFLKNLCLRPSCYDCAFKTKARRSDITLADFWGIQNVLPDMDDDKGTSLVIIQSKKGKTLFQKIEKSILVAEVDPNAAIAYNTAMIKSVSLPKKRDLFLKEITSKDFLKVQKKYCRIPLLAKIKRFVVRCIRKAKKIVKK